MILQTIKNYALGILDRLVNPENYNERLVNFYSYFQVGFGNVIFIPLFLFFLEFCGIVTVHIMTLVLFCLVVIPVSGVVEWVSRKVSKNV